MNLILCCGVTSLRERWASALTDSFTVYQANTLQDLGLLVQQKIAFELLFVHRILVDLDIVAYIRNRQPGCRVFILSDRPDEEEGLAFLRLGVVGYANSYMSGDRLREAAKAVAGGSVWVNQQLMQRLIKELTHQAVVDASASSTPTPSSPAQEALGNLSDREYQIAGLVANGLSNNDIAEQLGITERTVKAHLGTIYTKTSTKGRLGLALLLHQKVGAGGKK